MSARIFSLTMTSAIALGLIGGVSARAQEVVSTASVLPLSVDERLTLEQRLDSLERKVRQQQVELDSQNAILQRQEQVIGRQANELSRFRLGGGGLDALRAGGPGEVLATAPGANASGQADPPPADPGQTAAPQTAASQTAAPQAAPPQPQQLAAGDAQPGPAATPASPVGEAPPVEPTQNLNAALPAETSGVLTRPGHFVVEPSFSYSLSSSDRLVFRGVEIVTGIQIGVIEADQAQRNTGIGTLTGRVGLTDRSELEVRVPYVYRRDVVTTLAQRDQAITSTSDLNAANIGDIEVTGRYQLNASTARWPVIVANLRAKSDTGTNPYTVARDQFGVAQDLATGSGFWAIEPSLSFLFVSDPAVLFGNISYLHSFPKTINRTIGSVLVGRVTPGDSPGITGGFGFSLNPQFSFSLGYRQNYIFGTTTELGPTKQHSTSLQVGSLLFGMSYAFNSKYSLNSQIEMGVTRDAPDITLTIRTPISF